VARRLSTLLLVLGCLAVPLALTGVWTKAVLLSSDRYTAAISPLIEKPEVQRAVATALADHMLGEMDLEARALALLPDSPDIAISLVNQAEVYTRDIAFEFVADAGFAPIWTEANRDAHASLVNAVEGSGEVALSREGAIVLNLDRAAAELTRRFQEANLPLPRELIPSFVEGRVAVVEVGTFMTFRPLLHTLGSLYLVLPFIAAALLLAAVVLPVERWRRGAYIGGGLALVMIAFEVALLLSRSSYYRAADQVEVPRDISKAMWDPLVGGLDLAARSLLIFGIGLAFAGGVAMLWQRRT